MTLKDSKVEREDHKPIPKAREGIGLGLVLGTGLGLTPGLGPGPALDVDLGIEQELTVKATIMVTHRAYVPSPQTDPCS